jgi:hypothetical protein
MAVYLIRPPRSPLMRALAAVLGTLMLVGAFMLGLVFFAVLLGIGLVMFITAWVRAWWLGRKAGGRAQSASGGQHEQGRQGRNSSGSTIEAEYTVISRETRDS